VIDAAMTDLTSWVYETRATSYMRWRVLTHLHLDDPRGSGRAATVGMLKDLKHFGVSWDTEHLDGWARRRGWVSKDVVQLHEFFDGVRASVRFHTAPQPFHRQFVESWLHGEPLGDVSRRNAPVLIKACCLEPAPVLLPRAPRQSRATFLRTQR